MRFKRKLSEALYTKELHPSLNTQETSVMLKLFNKISGADSEPSQTSRIEFSRK